MFKSWQIFVFALVPLALVFAGVISASFHGTDSEKEVFPTPAPRTEAPTPPPAPPGATTLQLTAVNLTFNPRSLSAAAGQPVVLQMNNQDNAVLHNFALYNNQSLSQKIFIGELVTGPTTVVYNFNAPAPGTYFFRCDVHPDTMTGSFIAR